MAVALLVVVAAWPSLGSSSSVAAAPTGRIVYVHNASESGPIRWVIAEAEHRSRPVQALPHPAPERGGRDDLSGCTRCRRSDRGNRSKRRAQDPHARDPPVEDAAPRGRTLAATWSPNGRRLAYIERNNLRVIGVDGRGDGLVARFASGWFDWSPDGTRLAFASTTGDGRAGTLRTTLDVIPVAGGMRRTLFVDPGPYGSLPNPVWSPDGKTIAIGVGDPARILAVAATGGAVRTLTRGGSARWSPDGSTISFIGSGPAGVQEVWTMAADGKQKRRLTTSVGSPARRAQVRELPGAMVARRQMARLRAQVGDRDDECDRHFGSHAVPASLRHRVRRRRLGRLDFSLL